MLSDHNDAKISKIAFKTLKLLTNEQYVLYERSQNKVLPFNYECVHGNDHDKEVNKNIKEMDIKVGTLQKLHRFDMLTEHLGMQNIKPLYICATLKERLRFYGDLLKSDYTETVTGIRLSKEDQKYDDTIKNFQYELPVPAKLY